MIDGGAEHRFKSLIVLMIERGTYPSPRALNLTLHNRKSDNISGRETKWRREKMTELKIPLKRPRAIEPKILCCCNKPGCRCCA